METSKDNQNSLQKEKRLDAQKLKIDKIVDGIISGEIDDEDIELSDLLDKLLKLKTKNNQEYLKEGIRRLLTESDDETKEDIIYYLNEEFKMDLIPNDLLMELGIDGNEYVFEYIQGNDDFWATVESVDDSNAKSLASLIYDLNDAGSYPVQTYDLQSIWNEYFEKGTFEDETAELMSEVEPELYVGIVHGYITKGQIDKAFDYIETYDFDTIYQEEIFNNVVDYFLSFIENGGFDDETAKRMSEYNEYWNESIAHGYAVMGKYENALHYMKTVEIENAEQQEFLDDLQKRVSGKSPGQQNNTPLCEIENNKNSGISIMSQPDEKAPAEELVQEQTPTIEVEKREEQKKADDEAVAGQATYEQYLQKKTIKLLKQAAKEGYPEAQYELALHFMKLHKETSVWKKALKSIKGQKTNKDRAEEWMAKAAKQGYLPAVNHKW